MTNYFPADHPNFHYIGRFHRTKDNKARFAYPGSCIKAKFTGNKLSVLLKDYTDFSYGSDETYAGNHLNIIIDGKTTTLPLKTELTEFPIDVTNLIEIHTLEIYKRTESFVGFCEFEGVKLEDNAELIEPEINNRKIIFFGDSLTCGYGNEENSPYEPFSSWKENAYMSYSAIAARNLNAEAHLIGYSGKGVAQNSDGTKHNTLPQIYNRVYPDSTDINWNHKLFQPDLICINLGTNDFFSGVDLMEFTDSYIGFIIELSKRYPKATFLLLLGPMLNDRLPENALRICRVMIEDIILQIQLRGTIKIEMFEMSQQTGELGYGSNMHPSVAQHEKNANELIPFVKKYMDWKPQFT